MNTARRRVLALGAWSVLALCVRGAWAQDAYQLGDRLAVAPASDTTWEALVPPGWDPAHALAGMDFSAMADNDPRATQALRKLRDAWDDAPANPALEGRRIRIPGFVVPLEGDATALREFLLVPYFGACIHTPPPPANQIIHVTVATPLRDVRTMDAVWVRGTLHAASTASAQGTSGYAMQGAQVEPYRAPPGR